MSQHPPPQSPLAPIDANVKIDNPSATNPFSEKNSKPVPSFGDESRQHRGLHSRLLGQERTGKQGNNYVSPSDNIMSPASAKLNAFKEKRFTKSAKPRTLFAKTTQVLADESNGDNESLEAEAK